MRLNHRNGWLFTLIVTFGVSTATVAHVGNHPSVHDTVAGVAERMKREMPHDQLKNLNVDGVLAFLTEDERHVLGTEHLSFNVNVPVVVSVIHHKGFGNDPYWLTRGEFTETNWNVVIAEQNYGVWQKGFDAGWIGLGVNSLRGGGEHYLVVLTPKEAGASVEVTNLYPGVHRIGKAAVGEKAWADRNNTMEELPQPLVGGTLIQ
ncbi:MAG: hypothetical protein O3A46_10115, partial [Candidatus Poribacteria bacterium]|nr:hypothetical protein [Candidatus Poribacteria bacterium]